MKRLLLLEIIGLLSILSAYPLSRDYYLKQAESYQREAKYLPTAQRTRRT